MSEEIINTLYDNYYKLSKKFIDNDLKLSFDILNIAEKIKLSRYCNFFYSFFGDNLLNNLNNLKYIYETIIEDIIRRYNIDIYDVFQIRMNYVENFFNLFIRDDLDKYDEYDYINNFPLDNDEYKIEIIEKIYFCYFLIFDYFNEYNLFYISNYKKYDKLYSGIKFNDFIDRRYSTKTIFYLNLSRFISTSSNENIAIKFYRNKYNPLNPKQLTELQTLLFKFDYNKVINFCKLFDFNNGICIDYIKSLEQDSFKYFSPELLKHIHNISEILLIYNDYKTKQLSQQSAQQFKDFLKQKQQEDMIDQQTEQQKKDLTELFEKKGYNFETFFEKFDLTNINDIDKIRLKEIMNSFNPSQKIFKRYKTFSANSFCSIYNEDEILLLPNKNTFLKIDISKINHNKEKNIYYYEDNDDNDIFINSSELIKETKEGLTGGNNINYVYINFSLKQLNKLFNKEQLINLYKNNNIIYKNLYDDNNDIYYIKLDYIFKKQIFTQNINLIKENNLLKGGNINYKKKYLKYKNKYLNLKN